MSDGGAREGARAWMLKDAWTPVVQSVVIDKAERPAGNSCVSG